MKLLNTQDADFQAQLDALLDRDTPEDREVEKVVRNIIDRIRSEGDVALLEYTERFDQLSLDSASALEIKAPALRAAYES